MEDLGSEFAELLCKRRQFSGMESGDRIRALIAEMRGEIRNHGRLVGYFAKDGSAFANVGLPIPYREHLSIAAPTRVQDKRSAIRLCVSHISKKIVELGMYGGDRLEWIATRTMVADCFEGECADGRYSTWSRYLITCAAHQHQ